ncbi:MAG: RNA polymerase sigma factor [Aggregatilineales bacterium]
MSSYSPTCPNRAECACPAAVCEHEEEFQTTFNLLRRQLIAYVRRKIQGISAQDAEDLVADAMCKVAKHRLASSDSASWRRLAYKITDDLVKDYFRRSSRRRASETDLDDGEHHHAGDTRFRRPLEELVVAKENREQFKNACQLLNPKDQYILARYIAGDTFQQIAETLGLAEKTVRNRFSEAKAKLADLIAPQQR